LINAKTIRTCAATWSLGKKSSKIHLALIIGISTLTQIDNLNGYKSQPLNAKFSSE